MTTQNTDRSALKRANDILQGEMSAMETYAIALRRFEDDPSAPMLREIHDEHAATVEELRTRIAGMGGEPATESGAWGTFVTKVEKAASLFGEGAAIEALKQGEEIGVREYDEAIGAADTPPELRDLYIGVLRPRLVKHLDRLRNSPS